ncbi:MAG: M90 family metallopeptidase [Gammaproteobacteria bacterium]
MHLIILFGLVFFVVSIWFLRRHIRRTRMEKLFKTPLDARHVALLQKYVPIYAKLPQSLRNELHGHINIFLDRKNFIGKGGVEITDEIRFVVAGNACLLLLQGNNRRFYGFSSILIYPETYLAHDVRHDGFITSKRPSLRSGESWMRGPIVLSWADILAGSVNAEDGHNVVIHEFAHKLDEQSGHLNGLPVLRQASDYEQWSKVLSEEFDALHKRAEKRKNKVLDEYGTVSPAEFFAVASESFFEKPVQMKKRLPELYEQLQTFYNIDPASWD